MKARVLVTAAVALVAAMPMSPASAAPRQIEDPAQDHPVPFMDITGVGLALTRAAGVPALQVTFAVAGAITPETRTAMTGYTFLSEVGSCALMVRFVAYPDGVFTAAGFVTTKCGTGRDVGGRYTIRGNEITVVSPLRDLRGVVPGAVMTGLRASTAPAEGMYHDDTTAPSALGDAASSAKPWVIG